jgi:phosphatidylserine decarboxylase
MFKLFANFLWFHLPGAWQKRFSFLFSRIFDWKLSRLLIIPSCLMFGMDSDYLDQFEAESGKPSYVSYSDFFKRKYKAAPEFITSAGWPCEGYVCDWGSFRDKEITRVKGQPIRPDRIFTNSSPNFQDHYFVNIFLHNHNYHRIHSPTDGIIRSITHLDGDLIFLRPWFYPRHRTSVPALRNERVTIEFDDRNFKTWHLTFVGGFGVGTIELIPTLKVGSSISQGQELGHFRLGSTVCLASPYPIQIEQYLQRISVGQPMALKDLESNLENPNLERTASLEV